MPDVLEIRSIERLGDYRLAWNALLAQTPGASFFHTFDWLEAFWRHYGASRELRALVVTADRQPVGILPLCIVREATRLGAVRVLTYPLHDWGSFYSPIGPNPTATLASAMRYLHAGKREWDLFDLRWIDALRHDRGRTPLAMQNAGFTNRESTWKTTALVDFAGDWETYLAARETKFRGNVRRALRRLDRLGDWRLERIRPEPRAAGDGDPHWDAWEACLEVARQSWQGASESGTTLSHAQVEPFLRDAHEAAARLGAVDLVLLRVCGRPAAFAYNYCWHGRIFGLRIGHCGVYREAGLGTAFMALMLRDSFERGDVELDLGPEHLNTKRPWLTSVLPIVRYTHYAAGAPKAQLLRLKHWWMGSAAGALHTVGE